MKSDSIQRHRVPLLSSHAQHLRALLGIILATCACMLALAPTRALAADAGVIAVATVEDTASQAGTQPVIDITKTSQREARINEDKWVAPSKPHVIHFELRGMSGAGTNLNKTVEVTLGQGLKWITDTTGDIQQNLDTSKGKNGITTTALPKLADKFNLKGGTRTYHLLDGVMALDFNLAYTTDETFISRTGTAIQNGITITVKESGQVIGTAQLNTLYNEVQNGQPTQPQWLGNTTLSAKLNGEAYSTGSAIELWPTSHSYVALADVHLATLQVDDVRAKVVPTQITRMTFDDSGAQTGIYRLNAHTNPWYKPSVDQSYYSVELPAGTGYFKAGDVVKVTASYHLKGYDVDGSEYTITAQPVTYTVTATEPASRIYLNSTNANKPVQNKTTPWRIYNGDGIVAHHTFGSEARENGRTIEQRFDSNAHVYAALVMDSAGAGTAAGMKITVGYISEGETQERIKTVTIAEDSMNIGMRVPANYGENPATMLSFADFGLSQTDSITLLRYTIDIPPLQERQLIALGRIDDYDTALTNTIEVYYTDPVSKKRVSTGVSTSTHTPLHGLNSRGSGINDLILNAGTTSVEYQITNSNGWEVPYGSEQNSGMRNPIFHLVVRTKDINGAYLRASGLKLRELSAAGGYDKSYTLTDAMIQERVVENVGRVYTIDTEAVSAMLPDKPIFNFNYGFGLVTSQGKLARMPQTRLAFKLPIPKTAPNQSQAFKTMIYIEDRNYDSSVFATSIGGTSDVRGKMVDLNELGISNRVHSSGAPYFAMHLNGDYNTSLNIKGYTDVSVETSAKHSSATEYSTWEEGQAPISIGTKTSFDLKVDVINGSGQATNTPTVVYIPIPKRYANWGGLLGGEGSQALQFDVALNKAITAAGNTLPTNKWRAEYATVAPSEDKAKLDAESWSTSYNPNANCVRITIDSIPANNIEAGADTYSFILNCSVDDSVSQEGLVNTFRPLYYVNIGGERTAKGSYVSLQTALGEVRGRVFLDTNKNGNYDSGEHLRKAGVEVSAILDGKEVAKTTTGDDGQYLITDLNSKEIYVLRAKNPDTKTYVFARPGTPNQEGQDGNSTNQFIGQNNNQYGQTLSAFPLRAAQNDDTKATYNIGLMNAADAKTTFSFDAAEGTFADEKQTTTISGVPTAKVTAPTPSRPGYSYYWYEKDDIEQKEVKIASTFGYDDKTYVAKWTANTNTKYKVELYYQGRYGVWSSEPNKTVELQGTTDQAVSVAFATYAKYTDPSWGKEAKEMTYVKSPLKTSTNKGTVAGDGSLVLKLFYNIPEGPERCFLDVEYTGANKHWGHRVIHWAKDLDVIQGYEKGMDTKTGVRRYGHKDNITRAQIAVILWRMHGRPTTKFAKHFPDVAESDYFAQAVTWAYENKVVSGKKSGLFAPNESITRQDLAIMLANYSRKFGGMSINGTAADYKDLTGTPRKDAIPSVGWAVRNHILEGDKQGRLKPWDTASRADTAKMIEYFYRLLNKD